MNYSYEEIDHLSVTLPAEGCTVGAVCVMSNYGFVRDCTAGEPIFGKTESLTGFQAAVQVEGFVKVAYSGSAPQTGYQKLVADGNGGVKLDSAGYAHWVISVNKVEQTIIMKL